MNDISLVVYTNEKYLPIAKLSIDQIKQYFSAPVPKYLATNRFHDMGLNYDDFIIVDANTNFQVDASHFREVMLQLLSKHMHTKYFLYFSDDYYLIKPTKIDNLTKVLSYVQDNNIGYMSLIGHPACFGNLVNNTAPYTLPDIMKLDTSYVHAFSMQPAIWNREFFLQILESNGRLTLQMLDSTSFNNRSGKHIVEKWDYDWSPYAFVMDDNLFGNYAFDTHNGIDDYYILLYSEIMRHGKMNLTNHINNRNTVTEIINKYSLRSNPIFREFLCQ